MSCSDYLKNEEIWKKFYGIGVSNLGNVKTYKNPLGDYKGTPCALGYFRVKISINHKPKMMLVHRLVAHLFLGLELNTSNAHINHIDNDPSNNILDNLEIVNCRENCQKTKKHNNGKLFGAYEVKRNLKNRWHSTIRINGETKRFGYYKTEAEAHEVAVFIYTNHYGKAPFCTCEDCNPKIF